VGKDNGNGQTQGRGDEEKEVEQEPGAKKNYGHCPRTQGG
jgi:hypothetical protein